MSARLCVVLLVFALGIAQSRPKPDARLRTVLEVFIAGNNQGAEKAREVLRSGKTCLRLADTIVDADAVLEISGDTQTQGGMLGGFGARSWIVSGTLTLRTGQLIWSKSERFLDAPFMSGGKTAGELLVKHLAQDAACRERSKR